MNIIRINQPDLSATPPKFIQDIPKFVDNFRLTDWLELGEKGFIKRQVMLQFRHTNRNSGKKYMKYAVHRNPQKFIKNSDFLAQEMMRINNTPDISDVEASLLFDINEYDTKNVGDNTMFSALFMQYTHIDEDLVPDEWADCKENIQFPARDLL